MHKQSSKYSSDRSGCCYSFESIFSQDKSALYSAAEVSLLLFLLLIGAGCNISTDDSEKVHRISEFGHYSGFSAPRFDQAVRTSRYVAMRDGVRRAVDVYRGAVDGVAVQDPQPIIYMSQRYVRAWRNPDGTFDTPVGRVGKDGLMSLTDQHATRRYLSSFLRHGYTIVVADMRGSGASFGPEIEFGSVEAGNDEYDMIQWMAAEPWSTGNVGMIGISYGAEVQLMAAAAAPPSLKAIFPAAPEFDHFHGGAYMMGGIYRHGWGIDWFESTNAQNAMAMEDNQEALSLAESTEPVIAPVDDDPTGAMLKLAIAERLTPKSRARQRHALDIMQMGIDGSLFWDEIPYSRAYQEIGTNHLPNHLSRISASEIPVYLLNGWFDMFTAGTTRTFNNIESSTKRMVLGPWAHSPSNSPDWPNGKLGLSHKTAIKVEGLRWFDYWLKGIDNNVAREPSVRVAVMQNGDDWHWVESDRWPPKGVTYTNYYFGSGPSGTVGSTNDGLLSADITAIKERASQGQDRWTVDYSMTTGVRNRWRRHNPETGTGKRGVDYGDMSQHDAKGLTYTTVPLTEDVTVVGHPIVTLYATSTASDGDFIVYLEEIDSDGKSHYRTEGMLRASHRELGEPPYEYGGLPFPDSRRSVVEATSPLSAGIAKLRFELLPTANVFERGHRIRVTIAGIDRDNTATPILDPPPEVTVFRWSKYPSFVSLPVATSDLFSNNE